MTTSYQSPICPFPPAISPYAETIEHTTLAWAQHHGLIHGAADTERLHRLRLDILIARAYPQASLPALQWISDWNTWLFILDDIYDEADIGRVPEQLARIQAPLLAILHGGVPKQDDPMSRVCYELITRLHAFQVDASWLERFIQLHVDFFAGCVWEASNRAHDRIPDLEIYLRMRREARGVYVWLALAEFADQFHLPVAVQAHPIIHELALIANNMASWVNDALSIEKEQRHNDVHNLVIVLQHAEQCSWSVAMERAVTMHNAEVERFQTLAAQLPSFTPAVDADLKLYVAGLQAWVRGNFDWEYMSDRYRPLALAG